VLYEFIYSLLNIAFSNCLAPIGYIIVNAEWEVTWKEEEEVVDVVKF
jgi:hypothetical protein